MSEFSSLPGPDGDKPRKPGHTGRPTAPQARAAGGLRSRVRLVTGALVTSFVAATKVLVVALAALAVGVLGLLLVLRFVDPPGSMLMLTQRLQGQSIDQQWVPLDAVSPHLVRAVISSEDNNFCTHRGIDLAELEAAMAKADEEGSDVVRGASTITMQVAKNLFLIPARNYLRKGVEMGMAVAIELVWTKRRTLEMYLNIAEWGPGVFGAEAAARHHFRKAAARLTAPEAALMAAALPNPLLRRPGRPGPGLSRLAGIIETRARRGGHRFDCIYGPIR